MAGSKIFLEPILSETVNGVDGAIQDVITVLDPVPEKIDDQILMLSKVANVIGSSVSNIAVEDGLEFSFELYQSADTKYLNAQRGAGDYEQTTNSWNYAVTFQSYVNGAFGIRITACPNSSYRIVTNEGSGSNGIKISYTLTKNGNAYKSGDLYTLFEDNDQIQTYSSSITIPELTIPNNTCAANDLFELTITLTVSAYGGADAEGQAAFNWNLKQCTTYAGYKLVDIVDRGIIVQS